MYKPFKKRIIKHDDIASIDKLKSDFMALDAQIETVTSHETSTENIDSNDISDEIIFDDFEDDDCNEVEIVSVSYRDPPKDIAVVTSSTDVHVDSKDKESLEDLWNDSMNDESMLRCSQEIEAKLNLGPAKSTKEVKNCLTPVLKVPPKPEISIPPKPISKNSVPSPSTSKFKKYKSEPIDKNSSVNQRNASKDFKSTEFIDLEDFDMDDSFDDLMRVACAQAAKYDDNGTSTLKLLSAKASSTNSSNTKIESVKEPVINQKKPYYKPIMQAKPPAPSQRSGASIISNESQRANLASNTVTASTQSASSGDRRFFKSRNRSDSSFESNRLGTSASYSGVGTGSRGGKTGTSSVSTQMMDLRRTQSSVNPKTYPMAKENSTNCINHFNRLRVSDAGSLSGSTTVSRSQTLCTSEEIERKRMEARLKLEAKRKSQNTRNPVKR